VSNGKHVVKRDRTSSNNRKRSSGKKTKRSKIRRELRDKKDKRFKSKMLTKESKKEWPNKRFNKKKMSKESSKTNLKKKNRRRKSMIAFGKIIISNWSKNCKLRLNSKKKNNITTFKNRFNKRN